MSIFAFAFVIHSEGMKNNTQNEKKNKVDMACHNPDSSELTHIIYKINKQNVRPKISSLLFYETNFTFFLFSFCSPLSEFISVWFLIYLNFFLCFFALFCVSALCSKTLYSSVNRCVCNTLRVYTNIPKPNIPFNRHGYYCIWSYRFNWKPEWKTIYSRRVSIFS